MVDLSESWLLNEAWLPIENSTGIPEQDAFNPEKWTRLKSQSVIAALCGYKTALFSIVSLHMDI